MNNLSLKRKLALHMKNLLGWKTNRKIVVFSIDDYGNVRQDSHKSRSHLEGLGLKMKNRFDKYDGLETSDDLDALYETLSKFKDKSNRHPIVTAFVLPMNLDFDGMIKFDFDKVRYKRTDEIFRTFGEEKTWKLWQEGLKTNLIHAEYHGRSHFHKDLLTKSLLKKDPLVLEMLRHKTYTAVPNPRDLHKTYLSTYSFNFKEELYPLIEDAKEGVRNFEQVFNYRPVHFTAPGQLAHSRIERSLKELGIEFVDTLPIKNEYQGRRKSNRKIQRLGQKNVVGQTYIIRNCVFEPLIGNNYESTLQEIAIAFARNKPANISSHRVNFCGRIDEGIRKKGLFELELLLNAIVEKWPDVEFMTTKQLGELMKTQN